MIDERSVRPLSSLLGVVHSPIVDDTKGDGVCFLVQISCPLVEWASAEEHPSFPLEQLWTLLRLSMRELLR